MVMPKYDRAAGAIHAPYSRRPIVRGRYDAVTGGMYQLSPDQISAQLRNSGSAASVRDGQLFVFVVLVPNGDWRQIGSLTSSE